MIIDLVGSGKSFKETIEDYSELEKEHILASLKFEVFFTHLSYEKMTY